MSRDRDIELEIGAGPETGSYVVRVIHAATGGGPSAWLELDVEAILRQRDLLESTVLASAVSTRSVSVAERPVREVGQRLFNALFTGSVGGTYRASLGAAQGLGQRLRVMLRLTAPELAALPWEMLFDPEKAAYLCRQEPLVRHVDAPYTPGPLEVRAPLRILALAASPRDVRYQLLDVDAEKRHLAEALAEPLADGLVEVVWVPVATWASVQAQLLAREWHVVHFVGHGEYHATTDEGALVLVGDDGRAHLVEGSRFADLLGQAEPAPRLVVLNSCSSGRSQANDLFSGTAATLARSGISAVAAMQFAISDRAAIAFARGFYTAIAHGRSVDEAARSGRISILGAPRSLEWVTPVLYVRGEAAPLFAPSELSAAGREARRERGAVPRAQSPGTTEATDPARRRGADLRALFVEASAELRLEHFDTAIGLLDDLLTLDPDYSGAAGLRKAAERGRRLAGTYASALAREQDADWMAAIRGYDEILQADPSYRDVAARREACETRRRVEDLQAELHRHARAGQWQAVLDVDAELARLDPASSDPDGLASHARETLGAAEQTADLERRYAQARNAENRSYWAASARRYKEILEIDPEYRDVAARYEHCHRREQVAGLESKLRKHAAAEEWPQVLATIQKLSRVDAAAAAKPSVSKLASRAGHELAIYRAKPLLRINCRNAVHAVSWHPDGLRIAVGVAAARVRIFTLSDEGYTEQATGRMGGFFFPTALDVAFSLDGTRLAAGTNNSRAWVWDVASCEKALLEIRHSLAVTGVAFSRDGTRLATGSRDTTARVWDAASGKKLLEIQHGLGTVTGIALSLDGTRLATASADKTARVWDAKTPGKSPLLQVDHDDAVAAVTFSPDGTRLATASADKTARVWDAVSGEKLLEVSHGDAVTAVAFSPDGTRLATASADKTARVWDAVSGEKLLVTSHGDPVAVAAVAFSPDGTRLATGSSRYLRIWLGPVVSSAR